MAKKKRRPARTRASPAAGKGKPFPIVGVGASAGGLEAFTQLLGHLPADTGMAFVLIQHLDPTHTSLLAEALVRATAMKVRQADDGDVVQPDRVYVIPPESDLEIHEGRLRLVPRAENARRVHLPVDRFLRSLAAERGSSSVGVVLSGTASDGTEGLRAIKAEGGITFVQDPATAKFGGMPNSALQAGVVDHCLPLPRLAAELVRLSRHPYVSREVEPPGEPILRKILETVRTATGVDFGQYKRSTFERRLSRRMALRHVNRTQDYLELLQREPVEVRALHDDVLIQVTSFFRDGEVLEGLKDLVFPEILKHKPQGAPIRIWSAGCSSGEEAYSLAIALVEFLGGSTRSHPVQIFGSDVSERAIDRARAGLYPDAALQDVSEERRRRFFVRTEQGYRIGKMIRDLCVFVRHDLARDPPFSRIDLVSCRNVLIYFDLALQKRVLSTFHYCLNQPGYLLLGRSESIVGFGRLFVPVVQKISTYSRTTVPSSLRFAPRSEVHPAAPVGPVARHSRQPTVDLARHLDQTLMSRYAPPSVLVNAQMEILQFRGQTGAFLEPAPGEPQSNVVKMARPGLLAPLRHTIARARKARAPARTEGVKVSSDGGTRTFDLVVLPFSSPPGSKEPLFVVLFEESPAGGRRAPGSPRLAARARQESERRAEHELASTRQYLQSLIEEHVRTSDELEAANEELVSGNEELQSMNEELETAKEELQSTNEELTTVNDELQDRNQELNVVNGDLVNLLIAVDIPLLILDGDRRIRRFTPRARDILNVLSSDLGRPVDDIRPNIQVPDLDRQIAQVIETGRAKESEVQDQSGHWHRLQIRPYQAFDGGTGGAILALVDIDTLKHLVGEAQRAKAESERANQAKDLFLATLSHELRSPLSIMLAYSQLLQRGDRDMARVERASKAIERATKQQVQLIEDLLDVSRIVAGKLKMETRPVRLREVVKAALELVGASAERRSVALVTDLEQEAGAVIGDPVRLQQVVTNLLTNAIKFTPEGGRVSVTLARVGSQARLSVTDTGIGIEPDFLPRVFERFSQEDATSTRPYGGLGLGLAIVRHLAEAHGGTVQAFSEGAGRGSTFTVTLPLAGLPEAAAAPPVPEVTDESGDGHWKEGDEEEPLRGLRILVVDDDGAARDATADMLEHAGAAVTGVGSAGEAMKAVAELHPEVLVCDLAMPGEDGFSLVRRLRERGEAVPALALTALAGEDDRQRALLAGFQVHMAKPAEYERLTRAVGELARSARPAGEPIPG